MWNMLCSSERTGDAGYSAASPAAQRQWHWFERTLELSHPHTLARRHMRTHTRTRSAIMHPHTHAGIYFVGIGARAASIDAQTHTKAEQKLRWGRLIPRTDG